jgi:hemolysin activation/secretion protein
MRLGAEGMTLGGAFTYAWARPTVPNADVLARTLLGTVELGYPFVRHQSETVRGSVGMDIVNQDVELDHLALTRDRLRVLFLRFGIDAVASDFGPQFSSAEPPWHFSTIVELRQGVHALGATHDCGPLGVNCLGQGHIPPSRLDGQSDATVLRLTSYGEVRPTPKLTLALGLRAQIASDPLLSFENFSAGNYTVGRGYDPGALLGDRGYGTQLEIRYGSRIQASATRPAIQGYVFWDHAEVDHRGSSIILTQRQHLNSIGAGARVNWDRFVLDAGLAVPLTHIGPFNSKPDPRLLVSLTTRLWPWKY